MNEKRTKKKKRTKRKTKLQKGPVIKGRNNLRNLSRKIKEENSIPLKLVELKQKQSKIITNIIIITL